MKKNYIDLINESQISINIDTLNTIFNWMKEDLVFAKDDTCCLKLSDNKDIQTFNNKYRGNNTMTDVLTFPCEIPNIPFKGDIIVNTIIADNQKGNHTLEKELFILFIHGLLHLAGMNHITKKDQTRMHLYEEKYRDKLRKLKG